jgi:phage-related minor tail protein
MKPLSKETIKAMNKIQAEVNQGAIEIHNTNQSLTTNESEQLNWMQKTGRGLMAASHSAAKKEYKNLFGKELVYYDGWNNSIKLTSKGETYVFA